MLLCVHSFLTVFVYYWLSCVHTLCVCVCVRVGSAMPRQTRWPVFYLLLVTHHVIMAPGNPCNYYQHRVVWSELKIEAQHHGNNSRVCVPHQGPHNVSMNWDRGEPSYATGNSFSFIFRIYFIMCLNLKMPQVLEANK